MWLANLSADTWSVIMYFVVHESLARFTNNIEFAAWRHITTSENSYNSPIIRWKLISAPGLNYVEMENGNKDVRRTYNLVFAAISTCLFRLPTDAFSNSQFTNFDKGKTRYGLKTKTSVTHWLLKTKISVTHWMVVDWLSICMEFGRTWV